MGAKLPQPAPKGHKPQPSPPPPLKRDGTEVITYRIGNSRGVEMTRPRLTISLVKLFAPFVLVAAIVLTCPADQQVTIPTDPDVQGRLMAVEASETALAAKLADLREQFADVLARLAALESAPEVVTPPVVTPTPLPGRELSGPMKFVWVTRDEILIENKIIHADDVHLINIQGRNQGDIKKVTIRNCLIEGANAGKDTDVHGAFIKNIDWLVIEDCTFRDNGLYTDALGIYRWMRNHDLYLVDCGRVDIRRSQFINTASNSVKVRRSNNLTIEDCLFADGPFGLGSDDQFAASNLAIRRCIFRNIGGTQGYSILFAWGIVLGNINGGLIEDCTFIGPTPGNIANAKAITIGNACQNIRVVRPDFRGWTGTTISNYSGAQLTVTE
jgi:hypothetical protein